MPEEPFAPPRAADQATRYAPPGGPAQPQPAQPQHGQPQPAQPQHGQPQYSHVPYGPPKYGPPVQATPPYGQAPYGQAPPQHAQAPYGQAPYGQAPPQHAQAPYAQAPYAQAPQWARAPQSPGALLASAAQRLRASAVLLWCLQLPWVLFLAGGVAYLSAGPGAVYGADTGAVANADAFSALAALLYLAIGVAVWALTALWTCRVAEAGRLAGNGPFRRASMSWWGLFVPLAGLVLPVLAHREAAAYVLAGERVGGAGQGRGPWWRQEPAPPLLTLWWGLWAAAAVCLLAAVVSDGSATPEGALLVLTGLLGMASSVCGAVVLRRLARATAACSPAPWG